MDRMPLNKRQTLELFKDKKIVISRHLLGPIVLDNQTSHALCEFVFSKINLENTNHIHKRLTIKRNYFYQMTRSSCGTSMG